MTDLTDFFFQAYYTIARAIAEAGVNVDLFKTPQTIAVSLNRRVRAELKRLLVDPGPDVMVMDEAHRIKNENAVLSQALEHVPQVELSIGASLAYNAAE